MFLTYFRKTLYAFPERDVFNGTALLLDVRVNLGLHLEIHDGVFHTL